MGLLQEICKGCCPIHELKNKPQTAACVRYARPSAVLTARGGISKYIGIGGRNARIVTHLGEGMGQEKSHCQVRPNQGRKPGTKKVDDLRVKLRLGGAQLGENSVTMAPSSSEKNQINFLVRLWGTTLDQAA